MSQNKIELILHPIRMRIITTISGREMTTGQLAKALPDVAQATLYRHVNTLTQADVLTVVDERPVRGTVEKLYAVNNTAMQNITEVDVTKLSKDDHIRYFTTFLVTQIADFSRYLQSQDEINPEQDGVGYHTVPLYMTDDELMNFGKQLQELLGNYQAEHPDRKRRLFSFVIMPSNEVDEEE